MKKGSLLAPLLCLFFCYAIWGAQPMFWSLLSDFDNMFLMCVRVIMAALFTWMYLISNGQLQEIKDTFRNKRALKLLIPASLFICADWTLFIIFVTNGHVLDTTLGYYFNPLVIFIIGMVFFKEKSDILEYIAIGIVFIGILITTFGTGSFSYISVLFALIFPVYATIKRSATVPPVVSFAVETTILVPFALIIMLLFYRGEGGLGTVELYNVMYLVLAGLITALPMILYNLVVHELPFKVVGIFQYLSTTISFVCGILFMNEELTTGKLIMFIFIWVGLILFTIGNLRKQEKKLN